MPAAAFSRTTTMTIRLALFALLALAWPCRAADHVETAGTIVSVRGCDVGYRVYRPAAHDARSAPAVVVAHGFLRNGDYMRGWAEAIAARGLVAVTIDLCASSSPQGRHADDASDLVALRRELGIDDVVYAGVSAGGLAALIAASQDASATRAVLLLDPTNAGGQARRAASRVDVPVAALVSRPQPCNAWRNIDGALRTLDDATIVAMPHASHCDFEWPTDRLCRIACLSPDADPPAVAQARIRTAALSFLDAVASGDDRALARWKASLDELLESNEGAKHVRSTASAPPTFR